MELWGPRQGAGGEFEQAEPLLAAVLFPAGLLLLRTLSGGVIGMSARLDLASTAVTAVGSVARDLRLRLPAQGGTLQSGSTGSTGQCGLHGTVRGSTGSMGQTIERTPRGWPTDDATGGVRWLAVRGLLHGCEQGFLHGVMVSTSPSVPWPSHAVGTSGVVEVDGGDLAGVDIMGVGGRHLDGFGVADLGGQRGGEVAGAMCGEDDRTVTMT
eukprot:CAMPEP_0183346122 /NCGR_PEP_ID=MMETSP0164_2-20130417/11335_1 /TAXON_ID=221442 /ORGANISM="Coccolithus pelagicus ssp braarudi, Strain PLY182g" /LENGTH=211 /DNA_ID=CAMNT_0025517347 /DNA_START=611 /DNA_END=1247 /DNA_ORIENTATION=+